MFAWDIDLARYVAEIRNKETAQLKLAFRTSSLQKMSQTTLPLIVRDNDLKLL
jgi:hypothetical protein